MTPMNISSNSSNNNVSKKVKMTMSSNLRTILLTRKRNIRGGTLGSGRPNSFLYLLMNSLLSQQSNPTSHLLS